MPDERDLRFVVLASPRTGSSWLIDVLNRLEGTTAYGELFLPHPRRRPAIGADDYPRFIEVRPRSPLAVPAAVHRYLDGLYDRPGRVAFKLMYAHLWSRWSILTYLVRRRVRVIHLVRRNHLDVAISDERAELTGRSHVLEEPEGADRAAVRLDPARVLRLLRRRRWYESGARKLLAGCRLRHLEVAYEDLAGDEGSFRMLWSFLDLDPRTPVPRSRFVKRRRGSHAQVIRNYREIETALAGTRFARFLEPRTPAPLPEQPGSDSDGLAPT